MRKNSIWVSMLLAILLAILSASVPSGTIYAEVCKDARGRVIECPKKRPTIIYPSFTSTVTLTPVPTATKVPSATPTLVPKVTATKTAIPPATADLTERPGNLLLWVGGLLGTGFVLIIIYLFGGGGPSSFAAEAHGNLNDEDEYGEAELVGGSEGGNEDEGVTGSAGMYSDKELE